MPTPSLAATSKRIAIARRLEVEEAAEAAERGVRAGPRRRPGERADRLAPARCRRRCRRPPWHRCSFRPRSSTPPSHNALGFPRPTRQKASVKPLAARLPSLIPLVAALLAASARASSTPSSKAPTAASRRSTAPAISRSSASRSTSRADNAEKARLEGWRRAQSLGWRMLWARTHNRPLAQAPTLPDSVLNGIVSGIIIEQEQIGPTRYIAAPRRAVRPRPHRPDARRAGPRRAARRRCWSSR